MTRMKAKVWLPLVMALLWAGCESIALMPRASIDAPGAPNSVTATVNGIDTGLREVYLRTANNQHYVVNYTNETRVTDRTREYAVNGLRPGDQVRVDLRQGDDRRLYADRIVLESAGTPAARLRLSRQRSARDIPAPDRWECGSFGRTTCLPPVVPCTGRRRRKANRDKDSAVRRFRPGRNSSQRAGASNAGQAAPVVPCRRGTGRDLRSAREWAEALRSPATPPLGLPAASNGASNCLRVFPGRCGLADHFLLGTTS